MSYNLINTISNLPLIVGCKEFPTDSQGMALIKLIQDFINEEYKYTGQQVTEAFKMAIKRELYLDGNRIDPSTFGQHLSLNIVGKVLTAYKEAKQGNKARPKGYNYNQLNEAPKKLITPDEAYSLIIKWVKEDGEFPLAAPYRKCYEYLLEKGVVKPIQEQKSRGRFAQMIGSQMESDPYRLSVQNYLNKNL
jgi:hypothetical protein